VPLRVADDVGPAIFDILIFDFHAESFELTAQILGDIFLIAGDADDIREVARYLDDALAVDLVQNFLLHEKLLLKVDDSYVVKQILYHRSLASKNYATKIQSAIRKSPFGKGDLEEFFVLNPTRRPRHAYCKAKMVRLKLNNLNHGSGARLGQPVDLRNHLGAKALDGFQSKRGSMPGQSTMNHITSAPNSS